MSGAGVRSRTLPDVHTEGDREVRGVEVHMRQIRVVDKFACKLVLTCACRNVDIERHSSLAALEASALDIPGREPHGPEHCSRGAAEL